MSQHSWASSMSSLGEIHKTEAAILCCQCGVTIEPNPANMCVACLRTQVDITEGIPKQATIYYCRKCNRYLQPPSEWVTCALESRELLQVCLNKLKGLSRLKLMDAGFVWTEPHSKRIKVKLTVHGEVLGGTMLQQVFVVEYTVANQMCDDCHRTEAQNFWRASVQVRQKCENKKTMYYFEQLILKHKAHDHTLGIKPVHGGLDFFYATESRARKMIDFVTSVLPVKYQHSKKLLSHDIHSNIFNCKYTFSVEIVPLSKDSIVCLPKKLTQHLGHISPLCLVSRVTSAIHLMDPTSAQIAEVSGQLYWRTPFDAILNPRQLSEYIVMDIELLKENEKKSFPGQGTVSHKHSVADVWVVKACDLGINENTIHTRTHLGHLLKPGDSVLGYNVLDSNVNNKPFESLNSESIPDVILVKKFYPNRRKHRNWKLKHLAEENIVPDTASANNDFNEFMNDLEEDVLYRQNVNIYKADPQPSIRVDTNDGEEDPDAPRITLEEMLDDLTLEDVEMDEGTSSNQ